MATTSTEKKIWTDEEFMALSKDERRYEVVDGELVDMGNSGMEHGGIGSLLGGLLAIHVRQNKLGVVCDSSTAFTLKDGNRRSPDISFVAKERLKGLKRPPRGFFQGSPDLAVEILSPNNTVEELHEKIVEYFEVGDLPVETPEAAIKKIAQNIEELVEEMKLRQKVITLVS